MRISSGATLARTARIFAIVMGWNPSRPFAFTSGSLRYEGERHRADVRNGRADAANGAGPHETRLRQVLPDAGAEMEFEYGVAHDWHLAVVLDRLLPPNEEMRIPYCVDGAGGAPPLDVGGPWAYEEWRAGRPESGGYRAIADGDAAAEKPVSVPFSCDVVNAELARITRGSVA